MNYVFLNVHDTAIIPVIVVLSRLPVFLSLATCSAFSFQNLLFFSVSDFAESISAFENTFKFFIFAIRFLSCIKTEVTVRFLLGEAYDLLLSGKSSKKIESCDNNVCTAVTNEWKIGTHN